MFYFKCKWLHDFASEPVLLYSELDADRWELRKVELFADGRKGYASEEGAFGGTRLGEAVIPPLAEINADPQFEAEEISREAFEAVWRQRGAARHPG